MQRKHPAIAVLFGLSGTVSACNSTDMLYSQGPWGPAHVHRNYPEYSAPWGRRVVVAPQAVVDGPMIVSPDVIELDGPVIGARRYGAVVEPDIAPPPGFAGPSAEAASPLDPAISSPLALPANPQAPTGTQASAPIQASPPGVFAPPQRASSYAGSWKATIGSSSCKVQLSSVPSLDLYRASTQGCSQDVMRTVNGWSLRDNQVILFSRGQPVARLSGAEASLAGTLNNSGSSIEMIR